MSSLTPQPADNGAKPLLYSPKPVRFGLAARLSLALVGAVVMVFAVVFYYDYRESRRYILVSVQETVAGLSTAIVSSLGMMVQDVEAVSTAVAQGLTRSYSDTELQRLATSAISGSQDCEGARITLDPVDGGAKHQILQCQWDQSQTATRCEDLKSADTASAGRGRRDLIVDPSERGRWIESSLEPNRGGPIAVYELPIYRESAAGKVRVGAVGAELTLAHLAEVVNRLRVFRSGFVFVLSGDGRFLTYPDPRRVMSETLFDLGHSRQDRNLILIGQRMTRGETGFVAFQSFYLNAPAHLYFTPLPGTGWSIGIEFADDELFANFNYLPNEVILIGGVGLILLLMLVALIVRRFTQPLLILTEKTAAIAAGDLEVAIPESRTTDEVGVLTRSFAAMRRALRQQLEILAETRAVQARLDSELKIARAIQAGFLPHDPAALAGSGGLALATWFQPAREVGGDLYHCFWLEDGRLFLCVGDVAGKGVPGALMMAVTTTLVKAVAATAPDPAEVLWRVNRELCAMNDELLFVTLFAATLAPDSGELTFSNAGHNPPLIRRADGTAEFVTVAPALVLGVEPDCAYATDRLPLALGDILLLYTDGLTEAMNTAGECFGTDRLLAASRSPEIRSPRQSVEQIVAAVAVHVGTAEQSDDLTLLAIGRRESTREPDSEPPTP